MILLLVLGGGVAVLVLLCPVYFLVFNRCPYLYGATADFTVGDEALFTFGVIQHNLEGLATERADDGSGGHI